MKSEQTKLTKTGINAITSPFRWIIITAIIYFIASGTIEIIRVWIYRVLLFKEESGLHYFRQIQKQQVIMKGL